MSTVRGAHAYLAPSAQVNQQQQQQQHAGYFDNAANHLAKERSTVGSASATGSLGGGTTWASGSDLYDADKMSEDQDDGVSSGGLSDEGNASLVGFGEGASSTISGPISSSGRIPRGSKIAAGLGSPAPTKQNHQDSGSPMQGVEEDDPQTPGGLSYGGDDLDASRSERHRARDADVTTQQRAEDFIRAKLGNESHKSLSSLHGGIHSLGSSRSEEK